MNLAYLTDIIILLTAAVIAVPIFRFVGLGTVPGFLVAGMLVGPSALGLIDNAAEIGHLAELGVVLLLFVIGIELKPARLWLMRRMVFGLGTLQVVVTGALVAVLAYLVFDVDLRAAILIGPALALEPDEQRGFTFVQTNCAMCHAIGQFGDSPLSIAPPFRTLHEFYPIDSLQEALAEGIVTGHPSMPQFTLDPAQIDDVLAYLKTLE